MTNRQNELSEQAFDTNEPALTDREMNEAASTTESAADAVVAEGGDAASDTAVAEGGDAVASTETSKDAGPATSTETAKVPDANDAKTASPAGTKGDSAPVSSSNSNVTVMQDPDDPDMVIIRTRKKKRSKRKSSKRHMNPKLRIAIIVVAVIVGLFAAAGIALAIAVNVGNVNLHQLFGGIEGTPESAVVKDEGQTVEYKGHTYRYNENVVSIVAIGRDDESIYATRPDASCADMVALITLDTQTNKARAIVIPRNAWVPVDVYDSDENYVATRDMQLALAHAVQLKSLGACAANTAKSVARVFYNLPIKYYIDIDQSVVKEVSRSVGGVRVEALEAIPGEQYAVGDTVLLEGDSALKYVQWREKDRFESALERQARQVQFLKAFMGQVSSLGPQGILDLYNSVSPDIETNLGIPELTYLASCYTSGENGGLEISSISGTTEIAVESDGIEYEHYYLDPESVMENTLAAFYTQID